VHNVIEQIARVTESISGKLDSVSPEELEQFIQERENLIQKLSGQSMSPAEKEKWKPVVQNLLRQDMVIAKRIASLRDEASEGLRKMQLAKRQKSGYEGGYGESSLFYSTRK